MEKIIGIITVKQSYPLHYSHHHCHCFHQSHFPSQHKTFPCPPVTASPTINTLVQECANKTRQREPDVEVMWSVGVFCSVAPPVTITRTPSALYAIICKYASNFFLAFVRKKGEGHPGWGRKNLTKRVSKFFIKSHFSGLCLRD